MHVVLIDALNLIRRINAVQERPFLAKNSSTASEPLSKNTTNQILANTQQACSLALDKILSTLNATHALMVFDSDSPCWRYQLFPDYKKGRKKMPDYLANALENIQDAFMLQGVDSLTSTSDEADDLIATLAVKVAVKNKQVTIVSTDKGFLPLIDNNLHVYDYFNRRFLDDTYIEKKFKVNAKQLIDFWMLTGDSTNKIPGVDGIGQVTAASLLQKHQCLSAILSADDLSENMNKKLLQASEQFEMTRKLLNLKCDIPLGFSLKDIRLTPA